MNDTIRNYFDFINQKNFLYYNNLTINLNNHINQISFLQSEKILDNQYLNNNKTFFQDNFNNFFFHYINILQNEYTANYISKFRFYYPFLIPPYIYDNNSHLKNMAINNYTNNNLIVFGKENDIYNNFINNNQYFKCK